MQRSITMILSSGVLLILIAGFFISGCSNDPDECTRIVYESSPEVEQFDLAFGEGAGAAPRVQLEVYPHSKSPNKVIAYSLPTETQVSLSVHSASGKLLKALLLDETKEAGFHGVIWDGTNAFGQRVDEHVYVELTAGYENLTSNI